VARECAVQTFDPAAKAINEDYGTPLDGKQLQRWAAKLGRQVTARQDREVRALAQGRPPARPLNAPELLVLAVDGGRVQTTQKNPDTGSRWREDKVLALSSYQPGDGTEERPPQRLVTTCLGTRREIADFGPLARRETLRRGLRQAAQVLLLGDGAAWIDGLAEAYFADVPLVRIVDWYHMMEYLHAAAAATALPVEPVEALMYDGRVEDVLTRLRAAQKRLGVPQEGDSKEHPRRRLAETIRYLTNHRQEMKYGEYRRKGWPIGSGTVESAVKQFGLRVKGSEKFWNLDGVEPILALRGLWLSEDDRWQRHWNTCPAYTPS
jgi:hypothetical protein